MKKIALLAGFLVSISLLTNVAYSMKRKFESDIKDNEIQKISKKLKYATLNNKEKNSNIFTITPKMKEQDVLDVLQRDTTITGLTFKSYSWMVTESSLIKIISNYPDLTIDARAMPFSDLCIIKYSKNFTGILLPENPLLLCYTPNLKSLEMSLDLSNKTLEVLKFFLGSNKTITTLNISFTTIDINAAQAIASILGSNTTLKELKCDYTDLKDKAAWTIAKSAMSNQTLETLDFRHNNISVKTNNKILSDDN
jgi:hypothetical protein